MCVFFLFWCLCVKACVGYVHVSVQTCAPGMNMQRAEVAGSLLYHCHSHRINLVQISTEPRADNKETLGVLLSSVPHHTEE